MDTSYKFLTIGILHFGRMGLSLASELTRSGYRVVTCTGGRSQETQKRAKSLSVPDLPSVGDVFNTSDVIISICSGGGYYDIAKQASSCEFGGIYVDANDMPAEMAFKLNEILSNRCRYVDASIYGYPLPGPENSTTERKIYVSGSGSGVVSEIFTGTAFEVVSTTTTGKMAKQQRLRTEAISRTE